MLANGRKFTTFVSSYKTKLFDIMKYNEFHRWLRKHRDESGRDWEWTGVAEGSHYIYKDKNGVRYPVPNHGAKEFPEGLRKKILKDMGF